MVAVTGTALKLEIRKLPDEYHPVNADTLCTPTKIRSTPVSTCLTHINVPADLSWRNARTNHSLEG
jgi:hypothetical protein